MIMILNPDQTENDPDSWICAVSFVDELPSQRILSNQEKRGETSMSKNYKELAEAIIKGVGGQENVSQFEHCSTRLRFTLVDPAKAKRDELKAIPGVMGVVGAGVQCQVVIGNDVIEAYDAILKDYQFRNTGSPAASSGKTSVGAWLLDFLVGIFQPLVPAIAGAGILKALLSLFSLMGWMSADSGLYTVLYQGADAALYFLPVMVAVTMATKLKINRLVAVACVGALILPNMTTAIGEGLNIFGWQIQSVAYPYQIFPAILSVGLLYFIEKYVTKITPKPIRVFFVPMICFITVIPVTLLILGPLGLNIGTLLTTVILFLYDKLGWLAVGLLAAVLPFMIALGMHKALLPYAVSSISNMGEELLYMPASLAHNISESGACFGVALKTKDDNLRQTAISAGISALFGITEPALYGVTLQHEKAMISVVFGSFVGGICLGLTAVKAFVAMGPGLAGMAMFVDPANSMNIVWAFVGFGVSLVASFVGSLILFKDNAELNAVDQAATQAGEPVASFTDAFEPANIVAPVSGKCIPLNVVEDEVFASGIMGKGVAFKWEGDTVNSPVDGSIMMVAATKHAIGFKANTGQEILIHVGMDTVNLEGKGFTVLKNIGDTVRAGEPVMKIDRILMKEKNIDMTTPMVITNANDQPVECVEVNKDVESGTLVMVCD